MQDASNQILIARCIKRDQLAWGAFVDRFSALVFWAIKDKINYNTYLSNQQDIEDIFQNVFVLLWEKDKLKQIKNRENISAWLTMVTANCVHNYFRNKKKGESFDFEKEPTFDAILSSDSSANEIIDQEKLNGILKQLFNLLSAREHIILKLNYLYDKTHEEIGDILNMPTNTVSSIIKRSKEKLQEKLKEQGWED